MHLSRTRLLTLRPTAAVPPVLVWGLAAAFYLVAMFHRMSLGVAALDAERRFGLAPGALAVFAALQLGVYLAMQVPAGLAADRLGPRRTLAAGLALMAAGEVTFALATTMPAALVGRGLVGVGDACVFLNVLRLAQSHFPARRYALLACLAGLAGALGQVVTTVPLGLALDGLGWTPTFAASGALTALLVLACLRLVRDGQAAAGGGGREGMGAALRAAWSTPATRHGFWAHLALMGPFVTVTALWGYPYLVGPQGMSPGAARAHLMATVVAFGVASPVLGAVAGRRPGTRPAMLAALAAGLAVAWSLTLAWPGGRAPEALTAGALLLTGACGAAGLLAFDLAREGNPPSRGGAASGLVNLGGFSAAVGANLVIGRLVAAADGDLRTALWPVAAVAGVGALTLGRRALAGVGPLRAPAPQGAE